MLTKWKGWSFAMFAALAAAVVSLVPVQDAKAQFAQEVITQVETTNGEMILIGAAVIGVALLIMAIVWTKRAFNK